MGHLGPHCIDGVTVFPLSLPGNVVIFLGLHLNTRGDV